MGPHTPALLPGRGDADPRCFRLLPFRALLALDSSRAPTPQPPAHLSPPLLWRSFQRGAYFIGKVVWAKGYTELLDLMTKHCSAHGEVDMDCYGTGEDLEAVSRESPPPGAPGGPGASGGSAARGGRRAELCLDCYGTGEDVQAVS